MKARAACRTLGNSGYGGDVVAARKSDKYGGRHVIAQRPTGGSKGGESQSVYLIVSAPFDVEGLPTPEELTTSTPRCTNDPDSDIDSFRNY